ncbi:MAG: RNA polymerase subunit sigma-70 [Blastopirellula sp.]|nr:MAG: RNA polymerase subunit sigma-70 [Blastopirellula sp.]
MVDDSLVIDQVLAGESSSYSLLVRKYQNRLFNTLVQILGSREDAEDVVQEAFVQAYVKLDTFQGNSTFYTWLYRIAFNIAISLRRKKRPVLSVDQGRELAGEEPVDSTEAPDQRMQREESISQVHQALHQLSEEHRSILVLREIEGTDYEQISEILDLPIGTVRSRLHRARLQLKDQLELILPDQQRQSDS